MNLKQLEAFVYVADGGSFSKAARELYLTQPTVSAHISSLEKELNVRLFVRNTKEVNLSEDGRLLYEYAKQMIELEEKIVDVFLENGKKDVKCITIAASTIPAQYILPEILARFSRQYPGEQFKMLEADSQQVGIRLRPIWWKSGSPVRFSTRNTANTCLFIRMNWLFSCQIQRDTKRFSRRRIHFCG